VVHNFTIFEQQVSEDAINDIPDNSDEIQDLERELQRLKTTKSTETGKPMTSLNGEHIAWT
jgi:hypothetical protein